MHNPELHALAAVNWQYFCSFSFRSEKHCARFGPRMIAALVRTQARSFRVHFSEILWCLRRESGEATGRLHLHAVIAGLPPFAGARNCLALMSQWEGLGGGIARVGVYNSSMDGLDYILKGPGLGAAMAAGRVLVTNNICDFVPLHNLWVSQGREHGGIIVFPQQEFSIGETVRRLARLISSLSAEQIRNRLEWLNSWGAKRP